MEDVELTIEFELKWSDRLMDSQVNGDLSFWAVGTTNDVDDDNDVDGKWSGMDNDDDDDDEENDEGICDTMGGMVTDE